MAKKKKKGELPSGSIRRQVYNGMKQKIDKKTGIPVFDENGKPVMIRDYISVTAADSKTADMAKCEAKLNKRKRITPSHLTLHDGITMYINSIRATRSETTVARYEDILNNAFPTIMYLPILSLNNEKLQSAIDAETVRPSKSRRNKGKPISGKTLENEWGLISTVIKRYNPKLELDVKLPDYVSTIHELSRPEEIFHVVKDTDIELAVLLAMWLSFTISEIKGLKKSTSVRGDYLYIDEVLVHVKSKDITKKVGKNKKRNRMHRIPPYIKTLIDKVETDQLVTLSGKTIYHRFTKLLKANNMPHMSFHDLRHVNASVMSFLDIPDKYAMDRGGWSSDRIMKSVYMQIYNNERVAVDNKMDSYFEQALGLIPIEENKDNEKYKAWLTLFEKEDSAESKHEYQIFCKK